MVHFAAKPSSIIIILFSPTSILCCLRLSEMGPGYRPPPSHPPPNDATPDNGPIKNPLGVTYMVALSIILTVPAITVPLRLYTKHYVMKAFTFTDGKTPHELIHEAGANLYLEVACVIGFVCHPSVEQTGRMLTP